MRNRPPFWLPASSYYVLAVSIAVAFFFLAWGMLQDAGDEMPWVTAGIAASLLIVGAVILRGLILRRSRMRMIREQGTFIDLELPRPAYGGHRRGPSKLSIERNTAILDEINQKSRAAKVLGKYSSGHREVVEMCGEYASLIEKELKDVRAGSPRLGALLKGRSKASALHKYHMLKWAEIESQTLADEARKSTDVGGRLAAADGALEVIESALVSYPSEPSLLASREVLRELNVSINVSHWVEKAEKAKFRGDHAQAARLYRDALFYLGRDNIRTPEREQAAERISEEIERLRQTEIEPE